MKPSRKVLEALLVIGLILLIPLFFTVRTMANRQAEQNTPAPVMPTTVSAPEEGEAQRPKQPPACTFPLAQTTTEEAMQEEYTFSEPQVVRAKLSNIYEIIEWLPDNRRVLITQTYEIEHYQSIDLLNPQTGAIQVYATRTTILGNPVWVPGLNAVVYSYTSLIDVDLNNPRTFQPPYHLKRQLWMSQGNPNDSQLLEDAEMTLDSLSVFSIAANPNGSEIIYLANTDKQPSKRKVSKTSLEMAQSVPFDLAQSAYHQKDPNSLISYETAWRPGSTQVFLYTDVNHLSQARYTFLLDTESGQVCEINLFGKTPAGQLAVELFPRWSPNGRYLAVLAAGGFVVLDTSTGDLYEMDAKQLISIDIKGQLAINDIAWAPDSRHLAAAVQVVDYSVPPGEDYVKLRSLYLIDFPFNQAMLIPSDIKLGTDFGYTSLLWSDDGSQILVKCSAVEGLCLLPVHQSTQP